MGKVQAASSPQTTPPPASDPVTPEPAAGATEPKPVSETVRDIGDLAQDSICLGMATLAILGAIKGDTKTLETFNDACPAPPQQATGVKVPGK